MPILRIVLAQKRKPSMMAPGSLTVFAMIMPMMIAIMIALIGLFAKPSTDSPINCAA